jgi:diketogulonate reductase-like aldo/keto reductase
MENLQNTGKTRAIGISNANSQILMELLSYCKIKPTVNQIENHPYLAQNDLVDFCNKMNIKVLYYIK